MAPDGVRSDIPPFESPLGGLADSMVEEYLRARGYDPASLDQLPADLRDRLLKDASLHASSRLGEVESRAHYVQEIHEVRKTR